MSWARDFIPLLRMVSNLKLLDYFWNFPCSIFRPQLTESNWNLGKLLNKGLGGLLYVYPAWVLRVWRLRFYSSNGSLVIPLSLGCCYLVAKSCPTLCHSMDCSLPASSVHGISQARISMGFPRQEYWSGLPFLLQGIFPTQGSNLSSAWQVVFLPMSHLGLGSIF